jgi:hypothetical protein
VTLTWAEFVKEVEAAGVKPDTVIRYIDVRYPEAEGSHLHDRVIEVYVENDDLIVQN